MAVLSDSDRFATLGEMMRKDSINIALGDNNWNGLTKPDLKAAINALDTFLNDNAVTINQAIPQPARATLTTEQKAAMLMYVVYKRYLKGS